MTNLSAVLEAASARGDVSANWSTPRQLRRGPWLPEQARDGHDLKVSVAFYLRDEWEYPPEFFNGLARYLKSIGLSGVSLFSQVSSWARWGPAFSASQWDKIRRMGLAVPETPYGVAGRVLEKRRIGVRPISGAEVTFRREDPELTRKAISDGSGEYQQALSSGRYRVTASHPDYRQFTAPGLFTVTGRDGYQIADVYLSRSVGPWTVVSWLADFLGRFVRRLFTGGG